MGITSEILIYPPRQLKHITGESIQGVVRYHLHEDTEFKNIALSLLCKANCRWRSHKKTWYYGREKILVQKIYILNQITDEKISLSAGSYVYPFQIIIPENVPASVITSIGEIKYNLVLKFKSNSSFSWDKTFKRRIVIHPRIDSLLPDLPVVGKLHKTLYKPFSSKGQEIMLEAVVDKGYVTPYGERNISFNVINKSDAIFSIKTQLVSKTKYRADFNGKLTKKKILHSCTVQTPEIPDNSESNMFNIMQLAANNLCTVRHSEIISREYALKVTLKLPLPHVNSSVDIPIFIGEIPNRYSEEASTAVGESMSEMPPPYWEAMHEGKNDDDD
ncbi:hypothetical protein PYW08_001961 [Mythimna loreyi]|uniref:Uncharacterized protein n=1 Tax=Mythimna loreyi TaxID=667449 RepID=A0ACC2R4T2_9NEOP|nr:hypothetical protein PYW08_001961 [Mythimna loreyi]